MYNPSNILIVNYIRVNNERKKTFYTNGESSALGWSP